MLGMRRRVVIGLVAMLVLFAVVTGTVGARWIRLGDALLALNHGGFCKDGLTVGIAFTLYRQNGEPYPWSGRYEIAVVYVREDESIFQEDLETRPRLATTFIDVVYHEQRLNLGIPPGGFEGGVGNEILVRQGYSNYYGFSTTDWIEEPIFGPGIDAAVIIVGPSTRVSRVTDYSDCNPPSVPQEPVSFSDGRSNSFDYGATAAIFCEDNSVKVYGINAESQGFFAFSVTQDEIDALGQPAANTLLDSFPSPFGGDIRLYLLTTGELQLNAPGLPPESWKEYVFTWAGCQA